MSTDFLAPGRLWWMLAVVALGIVYVVVLRWRRGATVRFTRVDLIDRVAPARPRWRRHVVAALQLLGLAAAVVAMARPVERSTERADSEGRILLLFDVSLSMEADDVTPNRFEAARTAARTFVEEVEDDIEVGLIGFSGTVRVEVEPTLDRSALERGIDRLELGERTAIGEALATGTRLLVAEASDRDETTPQGDEIAPGVMVLLSDGETTDGRSTSAGATAAAEAGIPVFTIAFGTPSGAIPDPVTGDIIPVPVRPAELQSVADETGGQAFRAETGTELVDAYDQIRDSLGQTLGEEIEIVKELTWRWAGAAFVLLAAAWALSLWWLRGMV